jgi:DNA-binding response OmpR family regulator
VSKIIRATCHSGYFCIVMNTVLLIEPDKILNENLVELLQLEGYGVIGITNGNEVKIAIQKFNPSIIICDEISLNGECANLCNDLKEAHQTSPVQIIIIDGTDEKFKGADAYIKMPFRDEELLSKLNLLSLPKRA